MRLLIFLLASSIAFAQPQAWDPGTGVPTSKELRIEALAPASSTNVTDFRAELRISGDLTGITDCELIEVGTWKLYYGNNNLNFQLGSQGAGIAPASFAVANVFDIRIKVDFEAATKNQRFTIWDSTGALKATTSRISSDATTSWDPRRRHVLNANTYFGTPGAGTTGCNFDLHFLRVARGLHAAITTPPVDTVSASWDLIRLEMDGALTDTAAGSTSAWSHYVAASTTGAAGYSNSSVPPSISAITGPASVRVGEPFTLTAAATCMAATDGACASKRWVLSRSEAGQVRPSTSMTGDTLTARASQHGSVYYRLLVSDGSSLTTSPDFEVGNAASDDNGVAKVPSAALAALKGMPPMRDGTNPWPGAQKTWEMVSNKISAAGQVPDPVFGDTCPGTVSIGGVHATGGSARLFGSGTDLLECLGIGGTTTGDLATSATSVAVTAGHGSRYQYFIDNRAAGAAGAVAYIHPTKVTFAALPAANSVPVNRVYRVTDSAACTAGGGGGVYCISNGSTWSAGGGFETILITARATDTLTVQRAASPYSFAAGATINAFSQPVVWWNPPFGAAGSGRFTIPYSRCGSADANTCDATNFYLDVYFYSHPAQSGLTFSRMGTRDHFRWIDYTNGSYNWNYYDVAAMLYQRYYASGRTSDLEFARRLADNFWLYPNDFGYGAAGPKEVALLGLILRAIDGRPETWGCVSEVASCGAVNSGIAYLAKKASDWYLFPTPGFTDGSGIYEIRESGYGAMFVSLVALLHPDADVRAWFRTNKVPQAIDYYAGSDPITGVRQRWGTGDLHYDGQLSGFRADWGRWQQPFMHAWPMIGLLHAREVMLAAGDTTRAATALQVAERAATHVWDTRDQARRGIHYSVGPVVGSEVSGNLVYTRGDGLRVSESACFDIQTCNRALTNTVIGVFGWLYKITGNAAYRTRGCEFYAANYGGYPDDGFGGLLGRSGPCSPDTGSGEHHNALFNAQIIAKDTKDAGQGGGAAQSLGSFPGVYVGEQASFSKTLHMGYLPVDAKIRYTVEYADRTTATPVICTGPCGVAVEGNKGAWLTVLVEHLDNADQPIPGRTGRGVWKF